MENLMALYSIKNRTSLLKVRFSEYASRYSRMEQYQNTSFEKNEESNVKGAAIKTPQNEMKSPIISQ